MQVEYTYIEAIGEGYPGVNCYSHGTTYEEIIYEGGLPLPSKAELDIWIISAKRRRIDALVDSELARRKFGGIELNGKWFQTDQTARIQYLSLAAIPSASIAWETMSGEYANLTSVTAADVLSAIASMDNLLSTVGGNKHAEISTLVDFANYSIADGWPANTGYVR